jgi:hypothetical protein
MRAQHHGNCHEISFGFYSLAAVPYLLTERHRRFVVLDLNRAQSKFLVGFHGVGGGRFSDAAHWAAFRGVSRGRELCLRFLLGRPPHVRRVFATA